MAKDAHEEVPVGHHAGGHESLEGAREPKGRLPSRRRMRDQLGHQRIEGDRDLRPRFDAAVDPHVHARRRQPVEQSPAGRQKAVRGIFRVQARLDGMSAEAHVLLAEAEGVPLGDQDLLAHQIDARHRLGDRVLHLNARVHLEEIEAPVGVEQELDGPRALVPDRPRRRERRLGQPLAERRIDRRRRRLLEDLLVPPLNRALPLEQVHEMPVPIAQDLHLDMTRRRQVPLEEHALIAEGRPGLPPRRRHRIVQRVRLACDPHAPPATAARRLDQDRHADRRRGPRQPIRRSSIELLARQAWALRPSPRAAWPRSCRPSRQWIQATDQPT